MESRLLTPLPHVKIYLKVLFLRFFSIPANIATNECILTVLLSQVIMTKDDIIRYWVSSSDKDLKVMGSLFKNGHYGWSLFLGHLVLEKLLKAIYVKNVDVSIPFTHDLAKLSEKANIKDFRKWLKKKVKEQSTIRLKNI